MSELRNRCSIWKSKSEDVEGWGCFSSSLMASSCCTGNIQEVILQERIEKEDEVLVSLAGLKQVGLLSLYTLYCCVVFPTIVFFCDGCQIKDILKGALRFNQSQLEAEENEEITIADDHYTSTASAAETVLSSVNHHPRGGVARMRDAGLDVGASASEREEEEQATTPPRQQVN